MDKTPLRDEIVFSDIDKELWFRLNDVLANQFLEQLAGPARNQLYDGLRMPLHDQLWMRTRTLVASQLREELNG